MPSAIALCQQTQAELRSLLAHPASELPIAGGLDIALGCILLEQDALQEAERRLLHGLDQLRPWMSPHYLTTACLALFRLRQAQGRADEGLAFLARLEEAWPDIAFCTHALRLLHTLRLTPGDPHARAEAAAWQHPFGAAAKTAHPPGLGPFGAAEVYYQADLGWAEAQVISGSPQIAQPYLEQQLALSKAHGLASRVIELSLLQALAHQSAGHPDLARPALEQALAAGQPAGFVRIFDQGPILHRLLHAAQKNLPAGQHHAYLQRILAAIDRSVTSKAGNGPLQPGATPSGLEFGQHLSERALAVVRLMARGAANQDIADQLVITVGTVKSHINHILVKLEAHNRTEAVALARAAGLLDP